MNRKLRCPRRQGKKIYAKVYGVELPRRYATSLHRLTARELIYVDSWRRTNDWFDYFEEKAMQCLYSGYLPAIHHRRRPV